LQAVAGPAGTHQRKSTTVIVYPQRALNGNGRSAALAFFRRGFRIADDILCAKAVQGKFPTSSPYRASSNRGFLPTVKSDHARPGANAVHGHRSRHGNQPRCRRRNRAHRQFRLLERQFESKGGGQGILINHTPAAPASLCTNVHRRLSFPSYKRGARRHGKTPILFVVAVSGRPDERHHLKITVIARRLQRTLTRNKAQQRPSFLPKTWKGWPGTPLSKPELAGRSRHEG